MLKDTTFASVPVSALAKKLHIKPGATVYVFGAPAGFTELLDPLPSGAARLDVPAAGQVAAPRADVVLAFVRHADDLARLAPGALAVVRAGGVLWMAYPKGGAKAGTDLHRDILHEAVERAHGWTGVSLVAVDERWSAMRFRPHELVGT